jgi:hypothetical protein
VRATDPLQADSRLFDESGITLGWRRLVKFDGFSLTWRRFSAVPISGEF